MSPENQKETASPSKVRRKAYRSDNFREMYCNTSQGAFTPWDIEITFGRLGFIDNEQAIEELVTVVFSPQHAKAVSRVLASAVQSWEKQFGEIVLSADQTPAALELSPKQAPHKMPTSSAKD